MHDGDLIQVSASADAALNAVADETEENSSTIRLFISGFG